MEGPSLQRGGHVRHGGLARARAGSGRRVSAEHGHRSRRWLSIGLIAVVVVSAATAVVVRRRQAEPVGLASCEGFHQQLTSKLAALPDEISGWSRRQGELDPGDSYVELVDTPADTTWRYRKATTVPGSTETIEGTYRPGTVDQHDTLRLPGRS